MTLVGDFISVADNLKMNKSFIKKVGKNIKKLRTQKGLSQEALSAESNVSASMIGFIETARNDVTLSKIYAIAKALDVEPYELLK